MTRWIEEGIEMSDRLEQPDDPLCAASCCGRDCVCMDWPFCDPWNCPAIGWREEVWGGCPNSGRGTP